MGLRPEDILLLERCGIRKCTRDRESGMLGGRMHLLVECPQMWFKSCVMYKAFGVKRTKRDQFDDRLKPKEFSNLS